MQRQDEKKKSKLASDFAPALDAEPVFERPEAGRWAYEELDGSFKFSQGKQNPTGAWADSRASFGLESPGGFGFVDPGSFALASHSSPMMKASGIQGGAMRSASRDLGSAGDFGSPGSSFGGGGGGGGRGGGSGGGGGGGGRGGGGGGGGSAGGGRA